MKRQYHLEGKLADAAGDVDERARQQELLQADNKATERSA